MSYLSQNNFFEDLYWDFKKDIKKDIDIAMLRVRIPTLKNIVKV